MRAPFAIVIALTLAASARAQFVSDESGINGGNGGGVALFCGDSHISGTETCDDGNTTSSDGCSATCTVEAGFECFGAPSVCRSTPPAAMGNAINPKWQGGWGIHGSGPAQLSSTQTMAHFYIGVGGLRGEVDPVAYLVGFATGGPVLGTVAGTIAAAVDNLDVEIMTMTTVLDCDARNVSTTSIVCTTGGTWARVGASGLTTGQPAPFTEAGARSIDYDGVPGSAAPDTSTANITTQDFTLFWSGFVRAQGAKQHLYNKMASAVGVDLYSSSADVVKVDVNATTVSSGLTVDAPGEWDQWEVDCRHDGSSGSLRIYQNGISVGTGVCPVATTTNSATATVGRTSDVASEQCDCKLTLMRLWTAPTGTIGTNAALDTAALDRALDIEGLKSQRAVAGSEYPVTTSFRASTAYLDITRDDTGTTGMSVAINKSRLFRVGAKWPRIVRRRDRSQGSSGYFTESITGYLGEDADTNRVKNSNANAAASWAIINGASGDTDVAATYETPTEMAAGGNNLYEGAVVRGGQDLAGALEHGIRQAATNAPTATTCVLSAFVGYDDQQSVSQYVWMRDNTIGATTASWFDVYACLPRTAGAGVHAFSTSVMNGSSSTSASTRATFYGKVDNVWWCRIEETLDCTAAAQSIDIGASKADASTTMVVANTNDRLFAVWGVQLESDVVPGAGASSLVVTTGTATATRPLDELRYPGANIPTGGGTYAWSEMLPRSPLPQNGNINQAGVVMVLFLDASNELYVKNNANTSGNGLVGVAQTQTSGNTPYMQFLSGGVDQVDCCGNSPHGQWYRLGRQTTDGKRHHVRAVWMPNDVRVYMDEDEVSGITDTTVTIPDMSAGYIAIGDAPDSGTLHSGGVIEDAILYDGVDVRPMWP